MVQESMYNMAVRVKTVEVNKFVEMVLLQVFMKKNDKPEMLKALGVIVRTNIYRIMGIKRDRQ